MNEPLRFVPPESLIVGWDFSTGSVKCLAFGLDGKPVAEVRLPTDLSNGDPPNVAVCELNLMQLEGQARASVRALAADLKAAGRLDDWIAGGISATHHTAGRIDRYHNQVRRAICWNDQTLAAYRARGERRIGGAKRVRELIGGPWADRYTLSHLVKDEDPDYFPPDGWQRTYRILPHGPLAAGYLTGHFDVISVSSAASTGIMDLRHRVWCSAMLGALASEEHRRLALSQLPRFVDHLEPIGPLSESLALEAGLEAGHRPLVFPTSDDQQAGLVGGGAVDSGQMAIILGNSAVVNSSSDDLPRSDRASGGSSLDLMRLNWGPYLWMRCYNNGAQFLDQVVGPRPDWKALEERGRRVKPGCDGTSLMPFLRSEPSLKLTTAPGLLWSPKQPTDRGTKFRASLEALAFLIARGVEEHERLGQHISRITVSGGIARSDLMCEILASVLDRPLERLESDEGPALGAAVTSLAAMETHLRRRNQIDTPYTVADAVAQLVRFRARVEPNAAWIEPYRRLRVEFDKRLARLQKESGSSPTAVRVATTTKRAKQKRVNGVNRTNAAKRRRS
ncbi:MAG TPA: FGGY-family carbohydrate kinase [Planctomycetaceae bacterium]|jgi:sugar (pentulose or hexulose) kinase|nr:FGGY-family carbohydrate kinase [Planctomycetaceae bacterium]